jgi:hypothetical protein
MTTQVSRHHEVEGGEDVRRHWEDKRSTLVRAASFSPASPLLGWLTAWGAAIVAAACLVSAGVDLGLGLGIADGAGVEDGFWAGFWLAVVQGGAFLIGGYAAARVARRNGTRHAVLAWLVAMIATGADAVVSAIRDRAQVIADLGLPYWNDTGLGSGGDTVVALCIFALVGLGGAFLGGLLGQTANLAARKRAEHDLRPVVESAVATPDDVPDHHHVRDDERRHGEERALRPEPVAHDSEPEHARRDLHDHDEPAHQVHHDRSDRTHTSPAVATSPHEGEGDTDVVRPSQDPVGDGVDERRASEHRSEPTERGFDLSREEQPRR